MIDKLVDGEHARELVSRAAFVFLETRSDLANCRSTMCVQSVESIVIAWSEVSIRFCTFRRDQLMNRMLGMDTQAQEYISLERFLDGRNVP